MQIGYKLMAEGYDPKELVRQAVRAEEAGFDPAQVMAEDGPAARALVGDATVRGLLLGSDDGDEFWTAAGYLAAIRPDGHRPQLIEHHARLLTAMVSSLAPVL